MRKKRRFAGLLLCTAITGSGVAWAHHSFAAEFDAHSLVHLTGVVKGIEWSNPHVMIFLKAGSAEWIIEAAAPNAMLRRGVSKSDFKPGTEIVIDGYRARDGSNNLNGTDVILPGGRRLSLRYVPGGP